MSPSHMVILGVALVLTACGPSPAGGGTDSATGTGGDTSGSSSSSSSSADVVADETATTGEPPPLCQAYRHWLVDNRSCGRVGVGDVDADGVDDVVALPGGASFIAQVVDRPVYTYRGGALPLAAPELHCCVEMGPPHALELADVNADGRLDPVFTIDQQTARGDVVSPIIVVEGVVAGPVGGYLAHQRLVNASAATPTPRLAAGDFVPGTPAIAVASGTTVDGTITGVVGLYSADGLRWGPPALEALVTLEQTARQLGATDVDGDGQDDVVLLLQSGLQVLRSPGDGTLAPMQVVQPPALHSTLHVGDLDGMGAADIVLAGPEGIVVGLVTAGQIAWMSQSAPVLPNPWVLVDFDGDGMLDVVTAEADLVLAYRGLGDGTLVTEAQVLSSGVGEEVLDLAAGDLDGNGRDEVVVCDDAGMLVVSAGG